MKDKIRELIDRVYELEGLLHLSLKRDDASEDFLRLIEKKGREVGSLCEALSGGEKSSKETEKSGDALPGDFQNQIADATSSAFSLDEYSIDEEPEGREESDPANQENSEDDLSSERPNDNGGKGPGGRGKLVFSINERFRFKKELFRNSDADFNTTLALVASMDNYEEAEEFFLDEEGFDKNQPAVREFLEIIKRYFK